MFALQSATGAQPDLVPGQRRSQTRFMDRGVARPDFCSIKKGCLKFPLIVVRDVCTSIRDKGVARPGIWTEA